MNYPEKCSLLAVLKDPFLLANILCAVSVYGSG